MKSLYPGYLCFISPWISFSLDQPFDEDMRSNHMDRCHLLIVDESSMIDVMLMSYLVKSVECLNLDLGKNS